MTISYIERCLMIYMILLIIRLYSISLWYIISSAVLVIDWLQNSQCSYRLKMIFNIKASNCLLMISHIENSNCLFIISHMKDCNLLLMISHIEKSHCLFMISDIENSNCLFNSNMLLMIFVINCLLMILHIED